MIPFFLILKSFRFSLDDKKSPEQIVKIREKKFRRLLKYAYKNSSFYNEYYKNHGILEKHLDSIDIKELPVIDKKIYVENIDKIVTVKDIDFNDLERFVEKNQDMSIPYKGKYYIVHTSGSTGTPTKFLYDRAAWYTILTAGFKIAKDDVPIKDILMGKIPEIRCLYVAATSGRYGGVMAAYTGIKSYAYAPLLIDVNSPLDVWIEKLNEFNPNVIMGYPSAVKILCDLRNDGKIHINDAFRIITGGEPLVKGVREYIEKTLKTEVIDIYGCSESIILGFGTAKTDGLYFLDTINYVETDEQKRAIITPLYNFVQPLIKYRLSDYLDNLKPPGTFKGQYPYSHIDGILGRSEEVMWFINKDGREDFLHPLVLDDIKAQGLIKYQFLQTSKRSFVLRVLIEREVDLENIEPIIRKQLDIILAEKRFNNVEYTIERVEDIEINKLTGKSKLVVKDF